MDCLTDADEFFYCPNDAPSYSVLKTTLQSMFSNVVDLGFQEMRFMVYPYGARVNEKASVLDTITRCMREGYLSADSQAMFACWSSAATFFAMPKSADIASTCPFHYNHWYLNFDDNCCTSGC